MPRDNIPPKDNDLLPFATNISTRLTATPTAFGCTSAMATSLAGYTSSFASALAAAQNPETRGHSTVFAKDTARTNLVAYLRAVIRQIQGTNFVTNQQRTDLGITVRAQPQPIGVPAKSPVITVTKVEQNRVTITLREPGSTSRGRPAGVAGMGVASYVGDAPPQDISAWTFEGNTTRTTVVVEFPTSVEPFGRVWLTAFYFNPRGQSGVATPPVSTNLGTWLVASQNGQASPLESDAKLAA